MLEAIKDLNLHSATLTRQTSPRWLSPELLKGGVVPDFPADTWAFSMVMLEVFTGDHPFPQIRREAQLFWVVGKNGLRPTRPTGTQRGAQWVSDDVWEFLQKCWVTEPSERPPMKEVADMVKQFQAAYVPPALPASGAYTVRAPLGRDLDEF